MAALTEGGSASENESTWQGKGGSHECARHGPLSYTGTARVATADDVLAGRLPGKHVWYRLTGLGA
jgi:hypothetical protein